MYIEISGAGAGEVALVDADTFTEFKVLVKGAEDEAAAVRIAAEWTGSSAEGNHVHVPVERLHELAGDRARDPQWLADFEGMYGYAKSKEWVDSSGAIQAHVES